MVTFHKLPTGEWVAHGKASELRPRTTVPVVKRSGLVCMKAIESVAPVPHSRTFVYGFFTEHCKPSSKAAHDKRKRSKCPQSASH